MVKIDPCKHERGRSSRSQEEARAPSDSSLSPQPAGGGTPTSHIQDRRPAADRMFKHAEYTRFSFRFELEETFYGTMLRNLVTELIKISSVSTVCLIT